MNVTVNLMTTNTCSPQKVYRALQPKLWATCNLWMYVFLKSHHNCDAYMDVQKERKSTFFTAFEKSGKRGSQLVCCTILILQLSLKVFVI